MPRRGRGYTRLKRQGYGDPNRPTRASDYAGTGSYSTAYKKEFHPGRTTGGVAAKPKKLPDVISSAPASKASFGSFRNVAAESPRKGQAFEVVHRNGVRYHKYASGRLVADKAAGSGTKKLKRKGAR